jgi:hypothetical protein|nr:hypothetical protein [Planctomycetota bacterium]
MRILAHAATCLTKWHALDEQPALGTESVALFQSEWRASRNPPDTTTKTMIAMPARAGLRIGVPIPGRDEATTAVPGRTGPGPANMADFLSAAGLALPAPLASLPLPPYPSGDPWYQPGNVYITHDMIVNYHETSLKMIMRHAAENPYDWSSPRPMNRMLMTDFPLMQWDVIDNPSRSFDTAGGSPSSPRQRLTGTITGTVGDPNIGRITAQQWRPIAADDITNFGPNAYGTVHDWDQLKGEISHFSLTAAFDPAERCRELVFWSVDWTAFEDVETARSAPVDASRYPKTAPHLVPLATESGTAWERSFTLGLMGQPYQHRNYPYLRFEDISQPAFRNPEKRLLYITSVADRGTSDGIRHITIGLDDRGHTEQWRGYEAYTNESNNGADAPDAYFSHPKPVYGGAEAIPRSDPKAVFSGLFGADRDADGVLDRGPLPASTRMRAVEVARYTIYDPRLHLRLK